MKATWWFGFVAGFGIAISTIFVKAAFAADDAKAIAAPAAKADAAAEDESGKHFATMPSFHTGTTQKFDKINERAKQGEVDLLFLGDSITDYWQTVGKEVWSKYYGNRKAMNAGIGGDLTQHVLWRLDHGNIDGIQPKLCVLMIGTNNTGNNTPKGKEYSAEDIADGIKAIVTELREKLPNTKILLLGIFPRGATDDDQLKTMIEKSKKKVEDADMPAAVAAAKEHSMQMRAKNAKASELASKLADDKMIFYMDIGNKFLDERGILTNEIMNDYLHPNAKGYEIWAEAIEPKVAELLGEQK